MNALASFRVKPGFRVEVVAEAPMVCAPAAMAFDENGRLFVAEMRDYPNRRAQSPHLGRIRLLEDSAGEGVFDSSTIYADDLAWPSAIACYEGGVFVAATPEILYLKDSKGNGNADLRKMTFSGFGGTNALSVDSLVNSFNWGLDHRIHGGAAGLGDSQFLPGNDFSFDPRTLNLFAELGGAQSGLSFDSRGRKFVTSFEHPLRWQMYPFRYADRNPFFPRPPAFIDAVSPATRIFRFGSNAPGVAATNALSPAWLTSARGSVVYRGTAFPSNYFENVFMADPSAHVIHRVLLRDNGLEAAGARASDEGGTEFLVSSDPSFHPMQIVNGPDGAIYVADMRDGNDSGRIFRIAPEKFQRTKIPQLGKAKMYDLVAALAHPDAWRNETAARLLYERRDPAAVPLLTNMLYNARVPLARLRALHVLDALDALNEGLVVRGLRDPSESVREHAVLLSEHLIKDRNVSDVLWTQLKPLASDRYLRVRYQLTFTLGELAGARRIPMLAEILAGNLENQWIETAILSSLGEDAPGMLAALTDDSRFRTTASGQRFLIQLATMIGVKGNGNEVEQALDFINQAPLEQIESFSLLRALGQGLHQTRSGFALVDSQVKLRRFYSQALGLFINGGASEASSIAAIRLLGVSSYAYNDISDWLLLLLGSGRSEAVQSAAVATLARYSDARITTNLVARWSALTSPLRQEAVAALLSRSERVAEVLVALETGRIAVADVPEAQANFLRTFPDPAIATRAARLLGAVSERRPQVVERFRPALRLAGAPARGRQIFVARCAACHEPGGEGNSFGPDLAGARIRGKEQVLSSILEPSAQMHSDYATYVLGTKEGESLIGLLANENSKTVTLRQRDGIESVWPRENLQSIQRQSWSLMPEGLEQGMSTQDMSDLLGYIMAADK